MDDPFFGKLDPKKHKFTLEQLKQKPEGICHSQKEAYLTDEEFIKIFTETQKLPDWAKGLTREGFNNLKPGKKVDLRKILGIF